MNSESFSNINNRRRPTLKVKVGHGDSIAYIGGDAPVLIQSMTDTPTLDVEASVQQVKRLASAGARLVRLTAQGVAQAQAIGKIGEKLRSEGVNIPLSADIHFNPAAAFAAAPLCDKVRINPGNFADPARTFKVFDYSDELYERQLANLRDKLIPFVDICRSNGTAVRIGVNHGSLSDRIMSRFGDTPQGIVESAMEYLRIFKSLDFDNVVISIKSSNVAVMTTSVRLLVRAMDKEDMSYPLHLGVTEAGDGDMARIKSAVGIGSLLADGIGDTVRVSLSEDPVNEIPAANSLVAYISSIASDAPAGAWKREVTIEPKTDNPAVIGHDLDVAEIPSDAVVVEGNLHLMRKSLALVKPDAYVVLKASYPAGMTREEVMTAAAVDLGSLLLEGYGSAIWLDAPALQKSDAVDICLALLQATRRRISSTEYIACPGCGRTLFDLRSNLAIVKKATAGCPGLKIAVMGCIVNGPGEMADADFGYVGAGAGKVSVYKGKNCVYKNIDPDEALGLLLDLIHSAYEKN